MPAKELVKYVGGVDNIVSDKTSVVDAPVASSSLEMSQLHEQAARHKIKHILFFNSADGKQLRLQTFHLHTFVEKRSNGEHYVGCCEERGMGADHRTRVLHLAGLCGCRRAQITPKTVGRNNILRRCWCTVRNGLCVMKDRRTLD